MTSTLPPRIPTPDASAAPDTNPRGVLGTGTQVLYPPDVEQWQLGDQISRGGGEWIVVRVDGGAVWLEPAPTMQS